MKMDTQAGPNSPNSWIGRIIKGLGIEAVFWLVVLMACITFGFRL